MKKTTILIVAFLVSASIFSQNYSKITGKLKNGNGKTVYLQKNISNKNVIIDSAKVNKRGKYEIKTNIVEHDFFQLTTNKRDVILLLLKGNKETIKVTSSNFKDKNYVISNSKDNKEIQEYFQKKANKKIPKDSLQKIALKFIKNNSKSLIAFIAFNDVKNTKIAVEISEKGLQTNYKDTKFHTSLKQYLAQLKQQANKPKPVGIGDFAPELNMKSPQGNVITLASLKGKYVLIDFWASWCGPCRRENPSVVRLYNKYKSKGFEVYSVSLDKQKSRWEAAIVKDGLIWKSHVSDLKGWGTKATKMYGFGGIPYTVLIDKEGKVIATRLRGAALENKLKEIFGE